MTGKVKALTQQFNQLQILLGQEAYQKPASQILQLTINRIQTLNHNIQHLEEQHTTDRMAHHQELFNATMRISELQQALNSSQTELQAKTSRVQSLELQLTQATEQLTALRAQVDDQQDQHHIDRHHLTDLQNRLTQMQQRTTHLNDQLASALLAFQDQRQITQLLREQISDQQELDNLNTASIATATTGGSVLSVLYTPLIGMPLGLGIHEIQKWISQSKIDRLKTSITQTAAKILTLQSRIRTYAQESDTLA